jgi:hypothetical protein
MNNLMDNPACQILQCYCGKSIISGFKSSILFLKSTGLELNNAGFS